MAILDGLKKYFKLLPAHLTAANKKAAQIAGEIYRVAIENNSFADDERFNSGYEHRLEKYIVYYDIGKAELPCSDIKLNRPSAETEMLANRKTTAILNEIFKDAKLSAEELICKEILYYAIERNEQFDGLGFPKCIKGNAISPIGRILNFADYIARKMIDGNSKDVLIKKIKLKAGKKFDPNMISMVVGVVEDLYDREKAALPEDTEEFRSIQVLYQPVCDATSNLVKNNVGFICLNDPKQGVLMPSFYAPIAERNGKIMDITKFGFEQLFADMASTKHGGAKVSRNFTVNVSKECLSKASFLAFVKKMIRDFAINPQRLTFEIDAAAFDLADAAMLENLLQYRELGIKLAIDNYGGDNASLFKLQDFEFDTIKIDRSFIDKICDNRKTYEIVKNIIKMAEDLNITVVAKGVDNAQQKTLLLEMSCLYMQGRLFGEPEYLSI